MPALALRLLVLVDWLRNYIFPPGRLEIPFAPQPGAGVTRPLAPGLPVLVELVTHPEPGVACAAAGALTALQALWPVDTAALLLAADNVPFLVCNSALVVFPPAIRGSRKLKCRALLLAMHTFAAEGCSHNCCSQVMAGHCWLSAQGPLWGGGPPAMSRCPL